MVRAIAMAFAVGLLTIVRLAARMPDLNTPAPPPDAGTGKPQAAGEPEAGRTVKFEVFSKEDGSPLAGASVWVRATRGRVHTWEGTTDDQGRYSVVLPGDGTIRLDSVVARRGYTTSYSAGAPSPTCTMALERAETIGGIVRDERGLPIEGVCVFPMLRDTVPVWAEIYASPNSGLAVATTNAQGRWQIESLPSNSAPDTPLTILVTHPDHIASESRTTAAKARAFSIEHVMKTGVSVSGKVLGPFGSPVPSASVVITIPPSERMFLRLTTDKNGQFRSGRCFDPLRPKPALTVQASGLAMATREILVKPEVPPNVIRLSRRRPIEGRVVDAQGRPVVGATVTPSPSFFRGSLDWDADTDANGRFVWHDAPMTGTILLDVSKPTFRLVRERAVDPKTREVTISLHHPQHLHGTVTDADNGRPVERFTLVEGSGPGLPGTGPEWNRDPQFTHTFTAGRFDLSRGFFDDNSRQSLLIEAEGYQPGVFLGFLGNAEDVAYDFKLRKATWFSGIVRGTDGQLLAGADVSLGDVGSPIHVRNGWLTWFAFESKSVRTKTDRNGRYTLPSRDRSAWIAVVHRAGFALHSPEQLTASTEITVMPWARIEGVMKTGGRTASHQRVWARLKVGGFDGLVEHITRTDQDGRFAFDQVAPGTLTVFRPVPESNGHVREPSNSVEVQLAPGQTIRIQIRE